MDAGRKAEGVAGEYKMDVSILEQSKDKMNMKFLLSNSTPTFANTLRRAIISLVPTMAIQEVDFQKNSSVLYDEMIAHRLGLIPLKTDLKMYKLPEEVAEGSASAEVQLSLSVKADKPMWVYSSELKSKDPKIVPVFDKIPIVKLLKDQELAFTATARLGNGLKHAKHNPGNAYYHMKPEVTITKKGESRTDLKEICPPGVLDVKGGKLVINKEYNFDPKLFEATVAASEGAITVKESDKDFIFTINSWGQLTCPEIVEAAVSALKASNDEFIKLIKV